MRSLRRRTLLLAGAAALTPLTACGSAPDPAPPKPRTPGNDKDDISPRPLLIGAYTSGEGRGKGVTVATYDPRSGRISGGTAVSGVADPSFLAVHPSGHTVYAVNEREEGAVTALRLADKAGKANKGESRVLGSEGSGGAAPCHLSVHPSGRWLLSAHYTSGSVAVHALDRSGALGARTDLVTHSAPPPGPGQDGPHAHQFASAPDGRHLLAVDLGTDTVYSYRLDPDKGTLRRVAQTTLQPGAGPRHLTFHPSGRYAYLANELDNTALVCAYAPDTGRLRPGEPQSTGTGRGENYPAQFAVAPDGRFAYLANRGHDSVARYAVEADGARLRLLGTVPTGGAFPRHLALSPGGELLFVANQNSGTVTAFHVDTGSGRLRRAGGSFAAPSAACVLPL